VEADLQALPVGVFFFALGHDVDHPAGLVAACAAHALDVADGRRVRVKAHNQIYLQGNSVGDCVARVSRCVASGSAAKTSTHQAVGAIV